MTVHNFLCFVNLVCFFFSSEENIIFNNTLPCKSGWPNAQNCVEIDLSIKLKSKLTIVNATNQMKEEIYTMKHDELVRMWIDFGRKEFADSGYQVCMDLCMYFNIFKDFFFR